MANDKANHNIKTVVSVVGTTTMLTFIFSDGTTRSIPTNSSLAKRIIDEVTPALARNKPVEVDFTEQKINIFKEMNQNLGGFAKIYRVAKSFFGLGSDAEASDLKPISSINIPPEFKELTDELHTEEETLVAVIEETGAIVEGVEKLATQVNYFNQLVNLKGQEPVGLKSFLTRLSSLSAQRRHSAQELLDFLEKNELPIADDGTIVAYKRVSTSYEPNEFLDTYSKSIRQKLGTKVTMASADMVNPDRTVECSYGLHVGRRDYMGSFGGQTIVLVKIAPEDVIAVPRDYRASKMRCMAYTIVHVVSQEDFNLLVRNQPLPADSDAAKALAMIIKGEHTKPTSMAIINPDKTVTYEGFEVKEPEEEPKKEVAETKVEADTVAETEGVGSLNIIDGSEELVDPSVNSPKAIQDKVNALRLTDPLKEENAAPVLTEQQKLAKARWGEVKEGKLTKTALAKLCGTSTRSLDRWAIKFNF